MIKADFYPTVTTNSVTGSEFTNLLSQVATTERFPAAYYLGWIAPENVPQSLTPGRLTTTPNGDGTSTLHFTNDMPKNTNFSCGYLGLYVGIGTARLPISQLEYTDGAWVAPGKSGSDWYFSFFNKCNVMKTGKYHFAFNFVWGTGATFDDITSWYSAQTYALDGGDAFAKNLLALTDEFARFGIGYNHYINLGRQHFTRDDGGFELDAEDGAHIIGYINGFSAFDNRTSIRNTDNPAFFIDMPGHDAPCVMTGTQNYDNTPTFTLDRLVSGTYDGSYLGLVGVQNDFEVNTADLAALSTLNTQIYLVPNCGYFRRTRFQPFYIQFIKIFNISEIVKMISLQMRISFTGDDGYILHDTYAPYITEDNEFTATLITGNLENQEFKDKLRPWQYDITQWEENDYTDKDKPNQESDESEQSIFFNKIIRFFKRRKPKYTQNGEENELIKYGQLINRLADLDDETRLKEEDKIYLLRALKDIGDNHYWNESIDNLIKDFNYYFYDDIIEEYEDANGQDINKDSKIFHAGALKNADAGANFVKEEDIVEKYKDIFKVKFPWVIPWLNLNRKSYRTVRGEDKNVDILSDKKELQFTREEDSEKKYQQQIRLLMPKNLRKVEVEDLNRNFWVMGQVTSLLGSYLFGDDAIIPKTYNAILNEICQLWENIMYLWIATAAQSKKKQYTDVHCEVVPINSNSLLNYLKYDSFNHQIDTRADNNETLKHLSYLVNTYTDSNLFILLENRVNNYEHSYFSEIQYLLLTYDRNTKTWNYDLNKIFKAYLDKDGFHLRGYTDADIGAQYLYSINQDDDNYYSLSMLEAQEKSEIQKRKFVTLIRPVYTFSYDFVDGEKQPNLTIKFHDVGRKLVNKNSSTDYCALFYTNQNDINWPSSSIASDIPEAEAVTTSIKMGYYQGELISKTIYTKQINWRTESAIYNYITPGMSFSDIKNHVTTNSSDQIYQQLGITNPKETLENYSARFDLIRYSVGDGTGISREMIPLAILTTKQNGVCEQHKLYLVKQGKTISDASAEDIPYTCANPLEMNGSVGKRCLLGPTYEDNILGKENGSINNIALYYSAFQVFNGQHPGAATTTTNIKNPILNIHSTTDIENPYIIDQFYLYNMDRYTLLLEMKEDYNNKNDNHKKFLRAAVIWRKTCTVDLEKGYIYWYDEIKRAGRLTQSIITLPEERLDWKCGEQFPLHVDEDFSYLDTCTNEMIERAWLKSNNGIIDF